MSTPVTGTRLRRTGAWAPLALSAGLVALDVASGPGLQYGGAFSAVPLLAAAVARPVVTLVQGLFAVAACFALGTYESVRLGGVDDQWVTHQVVRVSLVLAFTLLAVLVAGHRQSREREAREVAAVADVAQQAILGPLPPRVGALDCASVYVSATSHARIGGDLVEVLDTPWGARALVGDVQGKGMAAVRLAGRVLGCFREAAFDVGDLPALAAALDRTVARVAGPEVFVTAALVQVADDGTVTTVSCGHPAPWVVGPDAARLVDVVPAPPLGMLALVGLPEVTTSRLEVGQRLALVTDGLLEARRPKRFSRSPSGPFIDAEELVGRALAPDRPLAQGLADVVRGARRWSRGQLRDDLAVLVLSRRCGVEPDAGRRAPSQSAADAAS